MIVLYIRSSKLTNLTFELKIDFMGRHANGLKWFSVLVALWLQRCLESSICKSNESYRELGVVADETPGTVRPAFLSLRGRSLRKALTACHGTSEALSLGQRDVM